MINADCIVHAEQPMLYPYREKMVESISGVLGVKSEQISIKATSGEGLGVIGEGSAIAARAVVLLEKRG